LFTTPSVSTSPGGPPGRRSVPGDSTSAYRSGPASDQPERTLLHSRTPSTPVTQIGAVAWPSLSAGSARRTVCASALCFRGVRSERSRYDPDDCTLVPFSRKRDFSSGEGQKPPPQHAMGPSLASREARGTLHGQQIWHTAIPPDCVHRHARMAIAKYEMFAEGAVCEAAVR